MSREVIYILKPSKRNPVESSSAEEVVMGKHFDHLERALADGRLLLAGPCEDRAFGIVVFRAYSSAR